MKIAVIGTGIAGNVAAYYLNREHDITVFESNSYFGGHTNTVDVATNDCYLPIDTGFIVYNDRTYPNFVRLMDRSTLILTDSGGIQEEAPSLNKPTLVMRETTERPEGIHAGVVRLVGADFGRIVDGVSTLLDDPKQAQAMRQAKTLMVMATHHSVLRPF